MIAIEAIQRRYGDEFQDFLLVALGVALFLVGAAVLLRALFLQSLIAKERHSVPMTTRTKVTAVSLGFVLGAILGLTSVGSGALIGLALILVFRLTPAARRRDGRVPGRDTAVGGGAHAHVLRQRRLHADGEHPHRLAAGRLARHAPRQPRAHRRPAHHPRRRPLRVRASA